MSVAGRLVIAVALLSPAASVAAEARFAERYPPAAIANRAQANEALLAAKAAHREADEALRAETQRCATTFLQNQCKQEARRRYDGRRREIRDVEIHARDVLRRLDAQERAARRARPTEQAPAPDTRASPPVGDGRTPPDGKAAAERAAKARAEAANRERYLQRLKANEQERKRKEQEEAARADERAANARAYEEKQREAAAYAKRKEQERLTNQKRREERRLERERRQQELEGQAKP